MEHDTVLVVDDDHAIRSLLVDFLSEEGFTVISADNGQEAIRRARQFRPDSILMDLNMPVLDGVTAIHCLKRDPGTREIRIYAMSARSIIDAHRGELDADGTIKKPFDLKTVVDMLSENGHQHEA